jgi:hypothetical protein
VTAFLLVLVEDPLRERKVEPLSRLTDKLNLFSCYKNDVESTPFTGI